MSHASACDPAASRQEERACPARASPAARQASTPPATRTTRASEHAPATSAVLRARRPTAAPAPASSGSASETRRSGTGSGSGPEGSGGGEGRDARRTREIPLGSGPVRYGGGPVPESVPVLRGRRSGIAGGRGRMLARGIRRPAGPLAVPVVPPPLRWLEHGRAHARRFHAVHGVVPRHRAAAAWSGRPSSTSAVLAVTAPNRSRSSRSARSQAGYSCDSKARPSWAAHSSDGSAARRESR